MTQRSNWLSFFIHPRKSSSFLLTPPSRWALSSPDPPQFLRKKKRPPHHQIAQSRKRHAVVGGVAKPLKEVTFLHFFFPISQNWSIPSPMAPPAFCVAGWKAHLDTLGSQLLLSLKAGTWECLGPRTRPGGVGTRAGEGRVGQETPPSLQPKDPPDGMARAHLAIAAGLHMPLRYFHCLCLYRGRPLGQRKKDRAGSDTPGSPAATPPWQWPGLPPASNCWVWAARRQRPCDLPIFKNRVNI